jgi:Type IV secretion system pilin
MKKYFLIHFISACILFSGFAYAPPVQAAPIVPKCNTGALVLKKDAQGKELTDPISGQKTGERGFEHECDFSYVILLIKNLIDFLLFYFATPLAALALAFAGWKMLSAGGSEEAITSAKSIIQNVIVGYIIALSAWLIVKTIFNMLGYTGTTFLK